MAEPDQSRLRLFRSRETQRSDDLLKYALAFEIARNKIEETFKGKLLTDSSGRPIEFYMRNEEGEILKGDDGDPMITYKRVGKPFLTDINGEFCETAHYSIMDWLEIYVHEHTALSNFADDDVKDFMRDFCQSLLQFLATKQNEWELDKAVMKAAYTMVYQNVFSAVMRAHKNKEWENLRETTSIKQESTIRDTGANQDQRGGYNYGQSY